MHIRFHRVWNSSGSSRSERPNRPQFRPPRLQRSTAFSLQIADFDMSKTPTSRGGKPVERMVHCPRMAPVAQLAEAAPIAPPQNLEAEESVLGAMMLSPGAIGAVSEILDASDFYRESHAKIYRSALGLYAKGEPVDAITLVDELEERGELEEAGGRVRLHELAALVPATANAAHYARIVREMATLRCPKGFDAMPLGAFPLPHWYAPHHRLVALVPERVLPLSEDRGGEQAYDGDASGTWKGGSRMISNQSRWTEVPSQVRSGAMSAPWPLMRWQLRQPRSVINFPALPAGW